MYLPEFEQTHEATNLNQYNNFFWKYSFNIQPSTYSRKCPRKHYVHMMEGAVSHI